MNSYRPYDPYRSCQEGCNHDLAPGVLVSDLLSGDGPSPSLTLVFGHVQARPVAVTPPAPAAAAEPAA